MNTYYVLDMELREINILGTYFHKSYSLLSKINIKHATDELNNYEHAKKCKGAAQNYN